MIRGHRKMAADTNKKTNAIRNLDPGENETMIFSSFKKSPEKAKIIVRRKLIK